MIHRFGRVQTVWRLYSGAKNRHRPHINSLAPGRFEWNCGEVIFKVFLVVDSWGIDCQIALRDMSLDLTDDKSTLVQIMAWCLTAPSHYLNQWWLRYLTPYGVTRPQWVKLDENSNGCPVAYFCRAQKLRRSTSSLQINIFYRKCDFIKQWLIWYYRNCLMAIFDKIHSWGILFMLFRPIRWCSTYKTISLSITVSLLNLPVLMIHFWFNQEYL